MLEAGAEVVETDTFQASRLKLEEWGLGEHTLEINRKAAEIARKAAGEDRFVAGSIGPTGHLPASDDPTLGKITFRELVEVFTEQAGGLIEGGADLIIIETAQDILEVKAADLRRARGVQADRPHAADPGQRLAAAERRQDAARHRHPGRAHHAHRARRGRDRAQLLDRPRGHARRDPLPRRELARCRCTASPTPGSRCRGPTARRSSPRSPSRWRDTLQEFVERYGVVDRRRLLRHHARTTSARSRSASAGAKPGAAPRARARPMVSSMMTATPLAQEPRADAGRRARQLAGLAQGEGAAAGRRLRRPAPGRRGPGRGRRARARPLRRAHRAPGRGRADARGGQARLAHPARADPDRLDRARGDRGRARADPRPRDRQLDQPRGRPRQGSTA